MKIRATLIASAMLCMCSYASADTIVDVDFSGSGTVNNINGAPQMTFNPVATFTSTFDNVSVIGSWNYDGTGTAAVNSNVHNSAAAVFGNPTRFDLALDAATAGSTYTITALEVDIRANNDGDINFSGGYRDSGGTPQLVGGEVIATQPGSAGITTYSVDMTSAGLSASDSGTNWNTSGTGRIRFLFNDGPAGPAAPTSDNFQVAAIRVIGDVTAIPEPGCIAGMLFAGLAATVRRKRSV